MKKLFKLALLKFLLLIAVHPAMAGVKLALDYTTPPSAAAYQSFTSPEQVLGMEKGFVYLNSVSYSTTTVNEIMHLGLNAGMRVNDNLNPAGTIMGGPTLHVPGAVLDWALGTKWGDAWVPALKTGIFAGYNIFRPETIKLKPSFVGFGVTYPVF